jgi:F-type H+-transporting ATPase subunit delta
MATNRLVVKEEVAVFASVLFDSANGAGGQEAVLQVREQMAEVIRLMRSDLDLTMALSNPDFTPEARRALVENVFAECHLAFLNREKQGNSSAFAAAAVLAFREVLAVMAERGQADLLPRVNDEFRALLGERLGICVVDVTTAVPLDDGLRQLITEKAEADLGKKAVLRERIDRSILGGIIMDVDGNYIDASMISQLNRARNVLKDTTDGGEC